ncbi:MAG: hypothetical protein Q8S57_11675 [Methanoregula sp.]|nr:hypothetical protein [Methanoregula sp.]
MEVITHKKERRGSRGVSQGLAPPLGKRGVTLILIERKKFKMGFPMKIY